jgi:NhaA family Na+:H+ antiporter
VTIGIVLGLVLGKALGVSAATFLAVRTGLCSLPDEMAPRHVVGVSAVAGIGFTISIFIAELAFPSGPLLEQAKVGVLAASIAAGALGAFILSRATGRESRGDDPP